MMQHDMDYSFQGCDNFVLITSTKKTEVMYQAAPEKKPYQEKHITYRQLTTSPIWEVHFQEWCTLMLKSTTGLLRQASPSEADSVTMSGS